MKQEIPRKSRGRPRAFNIDDVLDKALEVFRRKGYEGTSITDLGEAMGLNRPSIYAAFGNKDELFQKALDKYTQNTIAYMSKVFDETASGKVVRSLLLKSIDVFIFEDPPKGCLAVLSSLSYELKQFGIQQKIEAGLEQHLQGLEARFCKAISEGDLPKDTDPVALAQYVSTIHRGLSMQASNGVSKADLIKVVDQVMLMWPGKK